MKLLHDKGQPKKSVFARVRIITEVPPKDDLQITRVPLKSVHEGDTATNNPPRIHRALFVLVKLLKFKDIRVAAVHMILKMTDQAMNVMTDEEQKDTTRWLAPM